MSEGTYRSDPQKQQRAQEEISRAVDHGRQTLEEFLRRYAELDAWTGIDDSFAHQMKSARLSEGVIDAMGTVFEGLAAAWERALQLRVEVERPRDQALADIHRVPGHGPDTRKG